MRRVSIVKGSKNPDSAQILSLIKRAVELIGGFDSFIKEGDTVALKPNIVTGELAGPGITTDLRVIEALIKLSFEAGAGKVLVVEGSGYFAPTDKAFELSGVKAMAERNGAEIVNVDVDELVEVEVPNPMVLEKISVSKRFYEADVKVNIPVMKTHDQLIMTLAMKNMKGVIPKPQKRLFHRIGLAKAIVDLNKAIPPDLTIVDAINAMEGLGPAFGNIIEMDVIMACRDTFSLDVIGAQVMGINIEELDYLMEAVGQGLIEVDGSGIEVLGEEVSSIARRFERPPMDLAPLEGITIYEKNACSACRGTIRSVFYDLEQMGMLDKLKGLVMVVGPDVQVPEDVDGTPVIVGTCLKKMEDKGRYVLGCPPNNDKMIEAIREVCNLT